MMLGYQPQRDEEEGEYKTVDSPPLKPSSAPAAFTVPSLTGSADLLRRSHSAPPGLHEGAKSLTDWGQLPAQTDIHATEWFKQHFPAAVAAIQNTNLAALKKLLGLNLFTSQIALQNKLQAHDLLVDDACIELEFYSVAYQAIGEWREMLEDKWKINACEILFKKYKNEYEENKRSGMTIGLLDPYEIEDFFETKKYFDSAFFGLNPESYLKKINRKIGMGATATPKERLTRYTNTEVGDMRATATPKERLMRHINAEVGAVLAKNPLKISGKEYQHLLVNFNKVLDKHIAHKIKEINQKLQEKSQRISQDRGLPSSFIKSRYQEIVLNTYKKYLNDLKDDFLEELETNYEDLTALLAHWHTAVEGMQKELTLIFAEQDKSLVQPVAEKNAGENEQKTDPKKSLTFQFWDGIKTQCDFRRAHLEAAFAQEHQQLLAEYQREDKEFKAEWAKINIDQIRDQEGNTLMHYALLTFKTALDNKQEKNVQCLKEIIKILLQRGATFFIKNNKGQTPINYAKGIIEENKNGESSQEAMTELGWQILEISLEMLPCETPGAKMARDFLLDYSRLAHEAVETGPFWWRWSLRVNQRIKEVFLVSQAMYVGYAELSDAIILEAIKHLKQNSPKKGGELFKRLDKVVEMLENGYIQHDGILYVHSDGSHLLQRHLQWHKRLAGRRTVFASRTPAELRHQKGLLIPYLNTSAIVTFKELKVFCDRQAEENAIAKSEAKEAKQQSNINQQAIVGVDTKLDATRNEVGEVKQEQEAAKVRDERTREELEAANKKVKALEETMKIKEEEQQKGMEALRKEMAGLKALLVGGVAGGIQQSNNSSQPVAAAAAAPQQPAQQAAAAAPVVATQADNLSSRQAAASISFFPGDPTRIVVDKAFLAKLYEKAGYGKIEPQEESGGNEKRNTFS